MRIKLLLTSLLLFCLTYTYSQSEKMEVEGAITISGSDSNTPDAGTIRWTGDDFEGWDGTDWVSLTCCNGNDNQQFFCVNGQCVSGENGIYGSLNECLGYRQPDNAQIIQQMINGNLEDVIELTFADGLVLTASVFDESAGQYISPCYDFPSLSLGVYVVFVAALPTGCTSSGAGEFTINMTFNNPVCNPSIRLNDFDQNQNGNEEIRSITPSASSVDLLPTTNLLGSPISQFNLLPSPTTIDEVYPIGKDNFGWLNFTGSISTISIRVNKGAGSTVGFTDFLIPNCQSCN